MGEGTDKFFVFNIQECYKSHQIINSVQLFERSQTSFTKLSKKLQVGTKGLPHPTPLEVSFSGHASAAAMQEVNRATHSGPEPCPGTRRSLSLPLLGRGMFAGESALTRAKRVMEMA